MPVVLIAPAFAHLGSCMQLFPQALMPAQPGFHLSFPQMKGSIKLTF
jgi:hypothetical protein